MSFTKTRAFSVVYMFVISAIYAGILAGVAVFTEPIVKENQEFAINKSIVGVFNLIDITPETTNADLAAVIDQQIHHAWVVEAGSAKKVVTEQPSPGEPVVIEVWTALGTDGRPLSFAFSIGGGGFWGPIEGLLSVETDGKTIRNVVWTKHSETPGLGARIEEDGYRASFKGKLASPELKVVPSGSMGADPLKLDAITGATQTTIIGLGKFLPKNFTTWQSVFPLIENRFAPANNAVAAPDSDAAPSDKQQG
jgi:Na+-transporting NADH:ubiquinone oxidoreductase subunit C